ncbi:amino acid ABC transporter membrane protein 1, PAAT family [Cribrihabitans marinus]|uniref:Amino acid ABC transporter membrane protein 1, PAAT family n=1 Tax=Cribrihabitans marinus TaxID=1227549 RepID=A0A1H6Z7W3_9RHOB|nr:amino acid ABC transporter permease [Cribrihabitans marinus]GGH31147.1 polar amino acid ABC transporter permease [Cribrihabitans marinus]SEJ49663.1 amino acid ABC transporter membrane protein 1, PAAT family [Cribrihabitans marinus]
MTARAEPDLKGQPLPRPPAFQRVLNSVPVAVGLYAVVMALIVYGSYVGAQNMGYNWQWYRVPQFIYSRTADGFQWGEIALGLVETVRISLLSFSLATLLGLLVALLRLSGLVVGTAVAVGFLELIRNIPLLVLLYLFYYVLGPIFGMDRYTASVLTLAVFHSALISEILRAGINAVATGQWEAAKSIGMTPYQTYRYIILPQSVRFMLPPMTGEMVHLIKSSAIVSVIAVAELTTVGRNIISDTYMSFEIWFTIAAVYMALTLLLSIGVSYLERRYAVDQ